jgi:hypothetical protein
MASLEQELERLDTQIAGIRDQREKSHDHAERDRLQRSITMLDQYERQAIKDHHAERAAKQAQEEKAADAFQQHKADQQESADRALLRRRWIKAGGTDASFEVEAPALLRQLRIDRTLGRDVGMDIPSPRVAF